MTASSDKTSVHVCGRSGQLGSNGAEDVVWVQWTQLLSDLVARVKPSSGGWIKESHRVVLEAADDGSVTVSSARYVDEALVHRCALPPCTLRWSSGGSSGGGSGGGGSGGGSDGGSDSGSGGGGSSGGDNGGASDGVGEGRETTLVVDASPSAPDPPLLRRRLYLRHVMWPLFGSLKRAQELVAGAARGGWLDPQLECELKRVKADVLARLSRNERVPTPGPADVGPVHEYVRFLVRAWRFSPELVEMEDDDVSAAATHRVSSDGRTMGRSGRRAQKAPAQGVPTALPPQRVHRVRESLSRSLPPAPAMALWSIPPLAFPPAPGRQSHGRVLSSIEQILNVQSAWSVHPQGPS